MPSDVIIAVNHHLQRIVHGVCHIIYCDRNCQVANWKNHKEHCSFLKSKFDKYVGEKRSIPSSSRK